MFKSRITPIAGKKAYKYELFEHEHPLSYSDFITFLGHNSAFLQFFIKLLSNISFHAYHWETPPLTSGTEMQPFQFVVTERPGIDLPPEPSPFQQYFDPDEKVAVFDNLGGDAKLIAPTPSDEKRNYSHLGVFTDQAPKEQQKEFWQTAGRLMAEHHSDTPIWLNTAGGGVAWLHLRLDTRPKYYLHHPYTKMQ